jgi:hypothetical protein
VGADIAGTDRTKQRVCQRVKSHIRVGVAQQTLIVRYREAAEHYFAAFAEAMHVEAEAGARLECTCEQTLATRKIVFRGHLEIVLVTRDERDPEANVFRHGRVIRQRQPRAAPMRFQDRQIAEGLRCLHPP